jgi:NTE family protein
MDALIADLVLEGGGVKGIALVGAISVLEERGYTFNRMAGTSAGAIVGALVAAGFSGGELEAIMRTVDYLKFKDENFFDHFGPPGEALSIFVEHGIYKGDYLKGWLSEQLATKEIERFEHIKLLDPGSTLPVDQQYKLVVMTSDLSNGELRRLPWDYADFGVQCETAAIVDAVRASMSIPFFYRPVKVKNRAGENCWFVDGGMLSNFPIEVFDRTDGRQPRWPTFGIKLAAHADAAQHVINNVHDTISMTKAMVATMTGFYDRMHIDSPSVQARTIFVDTGHVRATDFDLDEKTQQMLYDNGRRAATWFLDGDAGKPGWNWERYLETYGMAQAVAGRARTLPTG